MQIQQPSCCLALYPRPEETRFYGVMDKLDAKTMDLGAYSDAQMLIKLMLDRCDYAVEELEYIIGGRVYDPQWPNETGLSSFTPVWATGPKLHFLVGNAHPKKASLLAGLNAGIARLTKDGEVERLKRTYLTSPSK